MESQDDKNLFASKFQDFGAVPSDNVWKGIEAALPEKRKKRMFIWWWTSGFAAALIAAGVLVPGIGNKEGQAGKKNRSNQHQITVISYKKPGNHTNSVPEFKKDIKEQKQENQLVEKNYPEEKGNVITAAENRQPVLSEPTSAGQGSRLREETAVNEKSAVLLPKPFDLLMAHSAVDRHSFTDSSKNDKNNFAWWIGVSAEQSNRFSSKIETTSQPPASYSSNNGPASSLYWSRNRNLQLNGGLYWRKWSFGTGFEYAVFDQLEGQQGAVIPGNGRSFGVPISVAYRFYTNRFFSAGIQFDTRLRYLSYNADSVAYFEVISTPSDLSPQKGSSVRFNGFQAQAGFGLFIDVPLYNRFHWNSVLEYQYAGYRSNDIRHMVNGSWLGVKTGILFSF